MGEKFEGRTGGRIGWAIEAMEDGQRVCRAGWNGKGMFLFIVQFWEGESDFPAATDECELAPFVAMKTADNKVVPWLASQTDILARDWEIVDV
jgi:hypothetical protein